MSRHSYRSWGAAVAAWFVAHPGGAEAQVAPGTTPKAVPGFELTRWAREPMLRSPVALSFDDQGRLYVAETARRGTVDIDIRGHQPWIVDDLANQSVDDLRKFFRVRMAPENSALNASWLRDYNQDGSHDWRDLMEVKEKVHLLEDRSGSGRADRATVFAEGFNEEINGVLAGVMPWGGDVFATVYPDLWRLRDTDGDGVADRKEIVFRGFGVHAAFDGHDLHGLTMGPDGKIYFSNGDNGFSVTNKEGRRLHHPNTGGVLRMNPDGSELEVFATGLRNPQEIAFDDFGNMFAVDNDGDLADERERFVFIAEGSDSGWRLHWQFREAGWARYTGQPNYNPWIDERMWVPYHAGQPAHITPPLSNYSIGPGSFKYNPGTALTDAYRGYFFLIQFPVAKVTAFQAKPKGAGFEMANEHVFVSGMMASAVNFSPDGALAIGDWDGMWSPSGKGSIWRVDDPGAAKSAVRTEVRDRLKEGAGGRSTDELVSWLGHADQRIRQRAQFELVRRGEFAVLRRVAADAGAARYARVHAIWGLGQGRGARGAADLPLADADAHVRAAAAKVSGDLRLREASGALVRDLRDPEATVRFQAALALGKIGDPLALGPIVEMLAADAGADAFLRHAGVMGLSGVASSEKLGALIRHESVPVRLAAVVALRKLGGAEVAGFLSDSDPGVRREAVRAIHDDGSIPGALAALAALIERTEWYGDPGMMRRILHANLRLGTSAAASRLARFVGDGTAAEELRVEAVECLAGWSAKRALDRVQGFVRPLSERARELGDTRIREHFGAWTRGAGRQLLQTLARVVFENRIEVDPGVFADWAVSEEQPVAVRAQALEWLARANSDRFPAVARTGLESKQPELRMAALKLWAVRQPDDFLRRVVAGAASWTAAEKQLAYGLAASIPGERAARWIGQGLDELIAGRLARELELDVLEAAAARPELALRGKVTAYDSGPLARDPAGRHRPTLFGGDAARGRDIFRTHPNAQCVRCHDAGGEGNQVGPVLDGIAKRVNREYLLESILQPSAKIAEGFATTSVVLRNGDEIDGVRVGETAGELALRLPSGAVRRLAKSDLTRQVTSGVSSMPPMGEVLTRFEIRDLVAYLVSLQ